MTSPSRDNAWNSYGTAWSVISTLLAGILVWGAIGWLVDLLVGTDKVFLPAGMVLGVAGSIYLVYLRHGRDHDAR